ncbi:MAG: hypothetical protein DRJ50_10245, partial [Actinobacteria bacterium]
MLMVSLMWAFVGTAIDTSRAYTSNLDNFRARVAAQSVASLTVADLWGEFESVTNDDRQLWAFRAWLDTQGLTDQSQAAQPAVRDFMADLALAVDGAGNQKVGGVEIERVDIHRLDQWDATTIVVEVDAVMRLGGDGSSRERWSSIREVFTIAPPEWDGLDYALLANNVNCLLCHTKIDNVERFYNQDQLEYGSFDQVRVGSIDSIHFRSDPDSSIAGVTLIGGDAMQGDGQSISDWSKFNLSSAERTDGKLNQDIFGNLTAEGLNLFDEANPDPNVNLFLDFFSYGPDAEPGFDLPGSFPAPFTDNGGFDFTLNAPRPDLAGNRIVDDSEFEVTVKGLAGSISGGRISVIPEGTQIANASDMTMMMNGNVAGIAGVTDGNVYLHGTAAYPIILDGDIAVDGDVIISGVVKGEGTIRARGNVYVSGDLVYADAGGASSPSRTYGFASDGIENNLAIAAGANIVIGDFYRPAWGSGSTTDGTSATSYNFTMEEIGIFNRQEWFKTQPTLPGKEVWGQTGTETVWKDEKVLEYYIELEPVYTEEAYIVLEPVYTEEAYTETVPVYTMEPYTVIEPVYTQEPYTVFEPIYEDVPTGTLIEKTVYKWVTVTNGLPEPYTESWTEKVVDYTYFVEETKKTQTGTKEVTKYKWVQTGTKEVTKYNNVQTGTEDVTRYRDVQTGTTEVTKYRDVESGTTEVTKSKWVNTGEQYSEEKAVYGNYSPQHTNPYYVPGHTARYYSFAQGQKFPIFNKDGYFDPSSEHWRSDETARDWDEDKLSYADPKDSSDSYLFNADGTPKAVVSSISPTADWVDPGIMRQLIETNMADDQEGTQLLEIDATLYSGSAILGTVPSRNSSTTDGTLRVNGGVVAADVGILAPGGTEVNYDVRGSRALSITAEFGLVISRRYSAPAVRY